jgi:hypothetical protein
MAKVNVYANLEDIGLFRSRQKNEVASQYERARLVRDRFAECMENALRSRGCVMPDLCAHGHTLDCAHLTVDYSGFTLKGTRAARTIPLPRNRMSLIDSRLRAIGTLVYREIYGVSSPLTGDIHMPSLQKTSFPGRRKKPATHSPPVKARGFFGRLFGS